MKNIIKSKSDRISAFDRLFITGYQLNGESIKINYSSGKFKVIPYTEKDEKNILEVMKYQAELMYGMKDYYVKRHKEEVIYAATDAALALLNGAFFLSNDSKSRYLNLAVMFFIGFVGGFFAVNANKNKKNIEELEKYKYLIENEDTINHEIALRYFDFYGKDADINEANRITLNNIDNYTLEDLKSIVELIESSDEYKLEHKRA